MSEFYTKLNSYLGEQEDATDIRAVVRRCWFYDFIDYPLRVWQGKGKLHTSDGNTWLGTIDGSNFDHHKTPAIKDGRDGSSARFETRIRLMNTPGVSAQQHYDEIKKDQWRVNRRKLTCFLALFEEGEGLRPETPIIFYKEFTMMNSKFSENMEIQNGKVEKKYEVSLVCKDGNFGRSEVPNGTYSNAIQQDRAKQLGVETDLGCQFVASLADRTYTVP